MLVVVELIASSMLVLVLVVCRQNLLDLRSNECDNSAEAMRLQLLVKRSAISQSINQERIKVTKVTNVTARPLRSF